MPADITNKTIERIFFEQMKELSLGMIR